MQHYKNTTNISELKIIVSDSDKLTSSLTEVMGKFNIKKHFSLFDFLKCKGLAVSSLLSILVILPFYGVANVYTLIKCGLKGIDFQGKKDAYYDIKNNEFINWRELLFLHAKRFMYLINKNINLQSNGIKALIFDDTFMQKTGKKIEKVSIVNDHASGQFLLGYKLLVCGFWDGASFIPLDFSLHRERGNKQTGLIKIYHKASKLVVNKCGEVEQHKKTKESWRIKLEEQTKIFNVKVNKTIKTRYEQVLHSYEKAETKLMNSQKELIIKQEELKVAKKKLKDYYLKGRLFGLKAKERQNQYKKAVSTRSFGFKRRKEADKDKISIVIEMLCRVVKKGIIPDYVLIDSWFFCYEILNKLSTLKKGIIKLVAMVKINNQLFTLCKTGKQMSVKNIIKNYERQASNCKKLKSKYIKVNCFYKGIRVNLFFIRMGKCKTWNLLITTDLDLNFIKLMEIYQIRWSIEVFFKESKQYLNLGACQSVNFDAQVAETTITMLQHVMLSYFKRFNYQQSIGGLFKEINNEIVELDLISRLISIFWELMKLLCDNSGIDFIKFQKDAIQSDEFLNKFAKFIPDRVLNKAA